MRLKMNKTEFLGLYISLIVITILMISVRTVRASETTIHYYDEVIPKAIIKNPGSKLDSLSSNNNQERMTYP